MTRHRVASTKRVIAGIWLAVALVNLMLSYVGPHAAYEPLIMLGTNVCGLAVALVLSSATGRLMRDRTLPQWPALVLLAALGGFVVWLVDGALQFRATHPAAIPPLAAFMSIRYNLVYFTLIFAFQTAAVALLSANGELARRERQLADATLGEQRARFAALQLQLNPHFLFNALNAVATLTAEARSEEAQEMIARLSNFLRMTLESPAGGMSSLDDELDAVQAYLGIEAVRFGDRLQISFECAADVGWSQVPHFLLQPLVENAMKHAVARSATPVAVEIGARREGDDLVVWVKDSGAVDGDVSRVPGFGIGLSNVAARLQALYGARGRLEATALASGFEAAIRLPLDRKEDD